MLCDSCGGADAAITLTTIENNEMATLHLCASCAAARGVDTEVGEATTQLADFLAQMGKGLSSEPVAPSGSCPRCGLTLADLKRTGRLGCSDCYTHFAQPLRGLLRRLHGSTQHLGKPAAQPDGGVEEPSGATRLVTLRRNLKQAVDMEDFERAALLRDEIRRAEQASSESGEQRG